MYTECSGSLWRSIARHLRETAAWQPIYWTGAEADRAEVKAAFPETIFHVGVDAAKGIEKLSLGETANMAEIFLAVRKADIAFSMMMEMRNKLVEAYRELQQMRI